MNNKPFELTTKTALILAALAIAVVGLTGYLFSRNPAREAAAQEPMLENMAVGTQSTIPSSEPATEPSAAILPQIQPSTPAVETTTPQQPQVAPSEVPAKKPLATASPVSGDTISDYAMDCLSYNETTRDWRTHNGIDLAAEDGTPVCAAADGTVYTIYEDDTLGHTVVIRHEGGYTTRYSSLKEELAVKPGDTVTLGQTIGYAGDTALIETVMGAHVHFSVSHQDTPIDPEAFLGLS